MYTFGAIHAPVAIWCKVVMLTVGLRSEFVWKALQWEERGGTSTVPSSSIDLVMRVSCSQDSFLIPRYIVYDNIQVLWLNDLLILFVKVEEERAANAVARHCLWLDR